MKKIIAFVIISVLLLSNLSSVFAAGSLTPTEQHAQVLNAINILKGDGITFNLDSKLKRSEGVTFIVRLLGKEKEVLENKENYIYTTLSDVNAFDWSAPYIGYCVKQGIIGGYPDKTFKPNDLLSEQAFVKMVLVAMGYEINRDFTWSHTFSFAYQKGVVTDSKYSTMKTDNTNYLRGNVVDLLYKVIGMNDATGTVKMAEKLIEAGVLTREQANTYSFIRDAVIMNVEKVERSNGNNFTVTFNEAPGLFTPTQIIVQEKGTTNSLEVKSVKSSEVPRMLYVELANQVPDLVYTMTFKGVKDTEGNVLPDYSLEFLGHRPDNYTSNYYRIAKVQAVGSNTLDVTFTQPIDIGGVKTSDLLLLKAGNPLILGTDKNMMLTADSSNPYLLHVELLSYFFEEADTFELSMTGAAKSLYGAYLKEGSGDSAKFVTTVMEKPVFALERVNLDSANSLLVTFNKSLNASVAEQVFSYYLTTSLKVPVKITKAELITTGTGAGKSVRLTTDIVLESTKEYNLVINQLFSSDRSESILDQAIAFVPQAQSKVELKILSVKVTANNRLEVAVDRYLDKTSAESVSLYKIDGLTTSTVHLQPSSVYYDSYALKPTLVFNLSQGLTDMQSYTLTIGADLKTASGVLLNKSASFSFAANAAVYEAEGLIEADYMGNSIVRISASRELALDVPNVLNTNYTLSYKEGEITKTMKPIGVTYVNANVIILRFETFDKNKEYQLIANSFVTMAGTTIDSSKNSVVVDIEEMK